MRKAVKVGAISAAAVVLIPVFLLAAIYGGREIYQHRRLFRTQPAAHPESKISITLFRSGCLGTCPSYCVRITNNKVFFDGDWYVAVPGRHEAPVDVSAVQELAQSFLNAGFYRLKDEYYYDVTDISNYRLTIDIDGKKMSVLDRWGQRVGMPESVTNLEKEVDRVAGTARWISAADDIVPQLEREHFDFKSPTAYWVLLAALKNGHLQTAQDLIARGAPVRKPKEVDEHLQSWPQREAGLFSAAAKGKDLRAIKLLLASSADKERDDLWEALAYSVHNGPADMVHALIQAGADPNQQPDDTRKSLLATAAGSGDPDTLRTILRYAKDVNAHSTKIGDSPAIIEAAIGRGEPHSAKRLECVRILLAAGADPNARDWSNDGTVLHYVDSKEIAHALIAAGADIHAKDGSGKEPDPSEWK